MRAIPSFRNNVLFVSGIMLSCISYGAIIADKDPASFLKLEYDENATYSDYERQLKAHLIMMYWDQRDSLPDQITLDKMMGIFDTLTERDITDLNLECYIAEYYYNYGKKYDEEYKDMKFVEYAVKYLENPKSNDHKKWHIYSLLGGHYYRKKQWQKAVDNLLKMEGLRSDKNYRLYMLAYCYEKCGDKETALKYFLKTIDEYNGNLEREDVRHAYYVAGRMYYYDKKDVEKAYEYWSNVDDEVLKKRGKPLLKRIESGEIVEVKY